MEEQIKQIIRDYLDNNLKVRIKKEQDGYDPPYHVIIVELDCEEISSTRLHLSID